MCDHYLRQYNIQDVTRHKFSAVKAFYISRSGKLTRRLLDTMLSTVLRGEEVEGDEEECQLLLSPFCDTAHFTEIKTNNTSIRIQHIRWC